MCVHRVRKTSCRLCADGGAGEPRKRRFSTISNVLAAKAGRRVLRKPAGSSRSVQSAGNFIKEEKGAPTLRQKLEITVKKETVTLKNELLVKIKSEPI